jgi:preprotein translocase subunit SecD
MTDTHSVEQRLRRTFQVVADQPIAPLGDAEPWRNAPGAPSRPRRQLVAGGLAVIVVIALVVFGITYGPRSSQTTPGTQPGLGGPTGGLRAVFAPARPIAPTVLRQADVAMMSRLHALGDTDATVSVDQGTIVVSSPTLTRDQVQLVGSTGSFFIRPVLCGAPAYVAPTQPAAPGTTTPPPTSSPACEAQYATTASNLDVNTNTGIPANTIGPDPIFASYPSTHGDDPSSTVLLPADPAVGAQQYPRFVLGPAELSGSNLDVASSQAQFDRQNSAWVVDVTLASSSAVQWDVVAQQNLHAYLGFDVDGGILEAPLIEPNQSTFASFRGQMVISGNFTATEAKDIAAVLGSGPLPVPFNLQSLTSVSQSLTHVT